MTNFEPCAAEVMRRFSKASGGEWIEVGGGVAGFAGVDSPVNAAKGMDGKLGRSELLRVIEFFGDRGKDSIVELAPWVEAHCLGDLVCLGFERIGHEDVMSRQSEQLDESLEEVADAEEWARVLSLSFFGEVNELGLSIGKMMGNGDLGLSLGIREAGELVAAGQLGIFGGAGLLAGDGTIEAWRGMGLQQRLIRGRVRRAFDEGVEWVHSEVQPESSSQRNYLRCGFSPIYARVHYIKKV